MSQTCLIVGAGQAGLTAAQTLREKGFAGHVTILGDEQHPPYQRPPLSKKFLSGEMAEDRLHLKPPAFYETNAIDLRLGVHVTGIDRARRHITTSHGEMAYDHLILATGTRPRPLPLAGGTLPGVHMLRGIPDVDRIRPLLARRGRLVIVGGGYIGLEVAAVARAMGLQVTVIEAQERVMARVVAEPVSRYFEALHRGHGVDLRLGTGLERIAEADGGLAAVTVDGAVHAADLVLVAIGALPNVELAASAGLEVADGIRVDLDGRTSDPHIYAAGDCTCFVSARYGRLIRLESVQNAVDQAKHVAAAIMGPVGTYDPVPWFWSDQYDVKLQIVGLSHGYDHAVTRGDPAQNSFAVFYLKGDRLLAVDTVNRPRDHMLGRRTVGHRLVGDVSALSDESADWTQAFAP